ncbi:MAG: type II toxin-antitoxin system RelE/ParE family toxin [Bacteroidetes bacterium]|nr:type II toxin-antitoxin system RelE/ParE family toxin [Bacteroidota bacterium]
MAAYKIVISKKVGKEIIGLPKAAVKNITEVIDQLASDPRPKGGKKLKGTDEELWRVRAGDYRVIYSIEDVLKIVEIRRVRHRKDVYL